MRRYWEGIGMIPVWHLLATVRTLVRNDPGVTTLTSARWHKVFSSTNNLACFVTAPGGATAMDRVGSNNALSLSLSLNQDSLKLPMSSAMYLAMLTLPAQIEFQ